MQMVELDLGAGDVALIIRGDGSVVLLLPEDEQGAESGELAPYNVGLITACGYLLTANREECYEIMKRLTDLVNLEGADA